MEQNLTLWINLRLSSGSRFTFVGILLDNFNPVIKKEEQRSFFCRFHPTPLPPGNGCSSDEHCGLSLSSPAGCWSPALGVWQSPSSCLSKALCCVEQGLGDSKDVLGKEPLPRHDSLRAPSGWTVLTAGTSSKGIANAYCTSLTVFQCNLSPCGKLEDVA